MEIFVEVRSGRPSPFRSPAATELDRVEGGVIAECSLLQAPSSKTTHVTISRDVDVFIAGYMCLRAWTIRSTGHPVALAEAPSIHLLGGRMCERLGEPRKPAHAVSDGGW